MALIPRHKKNNKNKIFFGREKFIKDFKIKLSDINKNKIDLLFYHGFGGLGKTTLKNKFKEISAENNFNINIDINLEIDNTIEKFYSTFIKQAKQKIDLFYFNIAFSIYWSKLHPNQELKIEELPFIEEGSAIAEGLSMIQGLSGSNLGLNLFSLAKKYSKKIKLKFNSDYEKELDELENLSITEIEEELPKFLNYDINNHSLKYPNDYLIFFIDTYEFLFENIKNEAKELEIDVWIRDLIISLQSNKVLFILFGREKLKWNLEDNEWNDIIQYKALNSFSFNESFKFLKENGIKEDNIAKFISNESEGVPFYLKLSLDTYFSITNPKIEDFQNDNKYSIFERFLRYSEKYEISTFKILAFTNNFDKKLFVKIIKDFNTGYPITDYEDLLSYSFIIDNENGTFSLHNLMKKAIISKFDNDFKKEINEYLFNYYYESIKDLKIITNQEDISNFENSYFYYFKINNNENIYKFYKDNKKLFENSNSIRFIENFFLKAIDIVEEKTLKDTLILKYLHLIMPLDDTNDFKFDFNNLLYSFEHNLELKSEYFYVVALYHLRKSRASEYKVIDSNLHMALKYKKTSDNLKQEILIQLINLKRKMKDFSAAYKYINQVELKNISLKNYFLFNIKKAYLYKDDNKLNEALDILLKIEKEASSSHLNYNTIYADILYAIASTYKDKNQIELSNKYLYLNIEFNKKYFKTNKKLIYTYRLLLNNKKYNIDNLEIKSENKYLIFNLLIKFKVGSLSKKETIYLNKALIFLKEEAFFLYKKCIYILAINKNKNKKILLEERKQNEYLEMYKDLFNNDKKHDAKLYIEISTLYQKLNNKIEAINSIKQGIKLLKEIKYYEKLNIFFNRLKSLLNRTEGLIELKKLLIFLEENNKFENELILLNKFFINKKQLLNDELVLLNYYVEKIQNKNKVLEYVDFYYTFKINLIKNLDNRKRNLLIFIIELKNLEKQTKFKDNIKTYIDRVATLVIKKFQKEKNIYGEEEYLLLQIEVRKLDNMNIFRYQRLAKAYFYMAQFYKFSMKNNKKYKYYMNLEKEILKKIEKLKGN